jgi:hypothetical protein
MLLRRPDFSRGKLPHVFLKIKGAYALNCLLSLILRRFVYFMTPTPPLATALPVSLPYLEASPWQQRQAAYSVGQLLEPAFPYLKREDWQRALNAVYPALYLVGEQVLPTYDGLAQVIHYAATSMPASPPRLTGPVSPAPGRRRKGARLAAPPSELDELEAALLAQLTNVSHWRSLPLRQITADVVTLGLRHFPDAQRPRPPADLF